MQRSRTARSRRRPLEPFRQASVGFQRVKPMQVPIFGPALKRTQLPTFMQHKEAAQQINKDTSMVATTMQARETAALIGSDKVEGTSVYGTDRSKIGSIKRVMIDKITGKVGYAVMSFGGFLGMGE